MAKLTLAQMIVQAAGEIGQTAPAFIVGNTDPTAVQMLALANREGRECSKRAGTWGGWPQLRGEYVFQTVPGTDNYAFPIDWQYAIPGTSWDRTFKWQLIGPLEAQEWQVLKSGITVAGPRSRYRIMDQKIFIDPVPSEADTIVFEYYSANWCQSNAATPVPQSLWAADTDTYILDEDLMIEGLKWRFLRSKGLSYDEERRTYDLAVSTQLARAGSARTLPLNNRAVDGLKLINNWQIPDSGYGT